MRALGVIGAGAMAATLIEALAEGLDAPLDRLSVLARPGGEARAQALLDAAGANVAASRAVRVRLDAFLADAPDLVAECAGHSAVREYGEAVLTSGRDLAVISIGALADDDVCERLQTAARSGGAQLILPAGAIGAIDALAAARLSGLGEVTYTGRKPPRAWRGTPAERLLDLDALTEPTTFYDGTAREAAQAYPQNANVAATVALAGAGFDATRVRLIADPGVLRNVHEIAVRSGCADFTIRLEGVASAANPKTSVTAGFSLARECLNRAACMVI